jgi:quercetin dioxygenase-like cupin family protein
MTPMRPVLLAALFSLATAPHPLLGQVTADLHTDPAPRVIGPEDGERRILGDGRHMLLKVGPANSGASYLFLGTERLPPGSSVPRHRHEVDEEILIVHRGEVTVHLDGTRHEASAGTVVYLPPRTWISVENQGTAPATIMFVFPRGSVERCFQFIGTGEDDGPVPTEGARAEERRSCQMTYRPR